MSESTPQAQAQAPAAGGRPSSAKPALSKTTIIVSTALVVITFIFYYFNIQAYNETLSDAGYYATYLFSVSASLITAIIIFWVAAGFGKGLSRSIWMLFGVGFVLYAIADYTWAYLDLVMGLYPYPGAPDYFYIAGYAFLFGGLVMAIKSYSKIVDIKRPLVIGALVSLVGIGLSYYFVLGPFIMPAEEMSFAAKFVSILYPVVDIVLILGPTVALALTVSKLGKGRFAWPWWIIAAGGLLYAATDLWFTYTDWSVGGGVAAQDLGWVLGAFFFAIAALVQRDVYNRH